MDEFYDQLAAAKDKLTIVYFYYSYCGSCLHILPKWNEVVREHQGISFLKVEVKDVMKVVEVFELTQVPTFVALLKQEEINRYTGSQYKELLNFIVASLEEYNTRMNETHPEFKEVEDPAKLIFGSKSTDDDIVVPPKLE